MVFKFLSVLMAILLVSGCASRKEIETMQRQLDYLEKSSTQMQDRIVTLDSLYRQALQKNVSQQADLQLILKDLLDRSSIIDNRLTDMEGRMGQIANRVGSRSTVIVPADTSGGGKPPSDSISTSSFAVDPHRIYESAFADLQAGKYDLAVMQFSEFISTFRDDPLADDAQYWLGECFYGKRDYAKAIPEFEKVEKNYPQSDKLTSALFKLGRSCEETGNPKKARIVFERIVKEFPDSFEAEQAKEKLKGMP